MDPKRSSWTSSSYKRKRWQSSLRHSVLTARPFLFSRTAAVLPTLSASRQGNMDPPTPSQTSGPSSGRHTRLDVFERSGPTDSIPKNRPGYPDSIHHVVVDSDFNSFEGKDDDDDITSISQTVHDDPIVVRPRSRMSERSLGRRQRKKLLTILRLSSEGIRRTVTQFFHTSFPDPEDERAFREEVWSGRKAAAVCAAIFFLLIWALTVGLLPRPLSPFEWYGYFGIPGFFSIPLPVLVMLDVPSKVPFLWQPWLAAATWSAAYVEIIDMHGCGFFTDHSQCGSRTFLSSFALAFGQPILASIILQQHRLISLIGAGIWVILAGVLLLHESLTPSLFFRDITNFTLFQVFVVVISYFAERRARQIYELKSKLEVQLRATKVAQAMEKRASDLTKRFVGYMFHEIRLPLNTALLAVQSLEHEGATTKLDLEHAGMVRGLTGSLGMMERVLNDVVSFTRMETGKFPQSRKPFDLHKSLQIVALPYRTQAQLAGLDLVLRLDQNIDKLEGSLLGDELRLRQITTFVHQLRQSSYGRRNLLSNAIKFTQSGSVCLATRLLSVGSDPLCSLPPTSERSETSDLEEGKKGMEEQHRGQRRRAVIRVEVHDTGVGLDKQLVANNDLFTPFVLSEAGRRQSGKGNGLGLALVRQIITLSRGRLGVDSRAGQGSIFWFELPYEVASVEALEAKVRSVEALEAKVREEREGSAEALSTTDSCQPAATLVSTPGEKVPVEEQKSISETAEPTAVMKDISVRWTTEEGPGAVEDPVPASISFWPDDSSPMGSKIKSANPPPLPHTAITSTNQAGPSKATAGFSPSPLVALVVDDDKLTRTLMSRMLTRLGHEVHTAENGAVASQMLRASQQRREGAPVFDIVMLDNQMPVMTGVECVRSVRAAGCQTFIVGCTGNALREDQEEYRAAGVDSILTKPIKQTLVVEMLSEARRRLDGDGTLTPPSKSDISAGQAPS